MPYKNREKQKEYQKQWYKNNAERIKENARRYYLNNLKKILKYWKQYNLDNREKARERKKQYRLDNPGSIKQWQKNNPEYMKRYNKQWYKNNREYAIEYAKQWYKNNHEKRKEHRKQYCKDNREKIREYNNHRFKTDLKYKLSNRMSSMIGKSLKGNKNGNHWEDLVGYTLNDLIRRLKSKMPDGYTWQDYLSGKLHIDHIIPISVFNYDKPENIDFKRCWSLDNLQLLLAHENYIKGDKLDRPFQPALKIEL